MIYRVGNNSEIQNREEEIMRLKSKFYTIMLLDFRETQWKDQA